jgi:hypothetical protein
MTLRSSAALLTALVTGLATAVLAAADITGTWTATFDTQLGEQRYTYEFRVNGSQLTGTAVSNLGKGEIKNGRVDGDTVAFTEILDFQGMPLEISYQGKIVSADQIDFTRQIMDITEKLVAKRTK